MTEDFFDRSSAPFGGVKRHPFLHRCRLHEPRCPLLGQCKPCMRRSGVHDRTTVTHLHPGSERELAPRTSDSNQDRNRDLASWGRSVLAPTAYCVSCELRSHGHSAPYQLTDGRGILVTASSPASRRLQRSPTPARSPRAHVCPRQANKT